MIIAGAQHPKLDPTDYGAMIRDLGLEDTVDLLKKHIPDEELDALYRQADICLFPYRDIYGSGALLMAYSYGKPVITSDIPAFREETQNGKTGILTDGEDPEKLKEAILQAADWSREEYLDDQKEIENSQRKSTAGRSPQKFCGRRTGKMNNQKQETSMKRAIMMNMFWALFSLLINTLMNFLITPYVTNNIGVEAYGFVALANTFISYVDVISVSLNAYAGRFISVAYHKGQKEEANRYFSSTIVADAVLGGTVFCWGSP